MRFIFILSTLFLISILSSSCGQNSNEATDGKSTIKSPVQFVIGVTHPKSIVKRKESLESVISLILKSPLGTRFVFFNASTGETINEFIIPNKKSMKHARVRVRTLKNEIKKLREFLLSSASNSQSGFLNIPISIRYLLNLEALDIERRILLIGPPIYNNSISPHASMATGAVPSVGHICVAPSISPYSLIGFQERKFRHQFYIFNTGFKWKDDAHREAVNNFWSSYINFLGGILNIVTIDHTSFTNRALSEETMPSNRKYDIDCSMAKAEWSQFPRPKKEIEEWIQPSYTEVNTVVTAHPPIGHVKLAMFWNCETCDLDIYARARSDQKFLYFNNARSDEGIFYKDYFTNPRIPFGFEYIEFDKEIDLRQLEILINFYGGSVSSNHSVVNGKVRIWFKQKGKIREVVEKSFTLHTKTGNRGSKRSGIYSSKYWTRLNIDELIENVRSGN